MKGGSVSRGTATTRRALVIGGREVPEATLRHMLGVSPDAPLDPAEIDRLAETLRRGSFDAISEDRDEAVVDPAVLALQSQAGTLLNAIGEGVCLADSQGRILWSNKFFAAIDADVVERISGCLRDSSRLFSQPAAHGAGIAMDAESPIGPAACKFEVSNEKGTQFFELYVTQAPSRPEDEGDLGEADHERSAAEDRVAADGAERVAGVVRDVTRSRRASAKLNAIDRAGQELVRLDADAIRGKNTYERLKLLERKIVKLAHDVLNCDHFAIFLIDERPNSNARRLELVISEGLPPEIYDLELSAETEGSGISGYVAATGNSYLCRDAATDEKYLPGLPGAQSSLTVPLQVQDKVIGILDVESLKSDSFDQDEQQFVEIFARHVALALHLLDLLVVERCEVNRSLSGRVGDELNEPLDDIVDEIELLRSGNLSGSEAASHLRRIRDDVDAIRNRVRNVAEGPQTLLGIDKAMAKREVDPELVGKRVLIADDQAKIRKVISEVLRARGADPVVCEHGGEAIAVLQEVELGDRQAFDLVLSDIRMPDRNGYEVFSASKRANPDAPVLLMTGFGYDPHHSIVRASQHGLAGVLFKPFEIERMLDEVKKALRAEAAE